MSSLHKVESRFRELNMLYMEVTKSDLDIKQSQQYLNKLIVNKKPGDITSKNTSRPQTSKHQNKNGDMTSFFSKTGQLS